MSLNFSLEEEDNNKEESINNYQNLFSNYENNQPSLQEALIQMFKSLNLENGRINELTQDIIDKCKKKIDPNFNKIENKYDSITNDDAYIICSYTCESSDKKYSPYKILNQNLVLDDREKGVENISKYLYILLKSIRKLPKYYPEKKYLYRCINRKVSLNKDPNNEKFIPYSAGNRKNFWGFTSTSTDPKIACKFLKNEPDKKTGTIFILGGDVWGYDIELFNYFGEKEILLEPERKFIIETVLPEINEIININCTILKTPLILCNNNELLSSIESFSSIQDAHNTNNIPSFNMLKNKYIVKLEMEARISDRATYTSGIGILCKIPSKNIKALITYNHIINLDFLNEGKKLILYIDNLEKELDMKINRYKYTNKDFDITIIEILGNDNIKHFIEIDKYINSRNYIDTDIIAVTLKDNKDIKLFNGKIKEESNGNYICDIKLIKEGMVILEEKNRLLGIIKENNNDNEIEFIPMNIIIDKINFIKCKYKIKKEDIEKYIQIINNKNYKGDIKNEEITKEIKLIIGGEIKSNILTYIFYKEGIYIIYLISNNVLTDMSWMFTNCSSLIELDLSSFETNQVLDMKYLFDNCSSLKKLNFSGFNTSQVTNMSWMFNNCCSLEKLEISSFVTNKVTDISWMFSKCSKLKELNLSKFNTSQVTNMKCLFSECSSLKELNLSKFNTSHVNDISWMFHDCSSLKELNLSSFNTNEVIDMRCMFDNCTSLEKINLSSFNTNKVIDMKYMFNNCSSLKELDLSKFNTSQVTDMKCMFNNCSSLKELDISSFNIDKVTEKSCIFNSINKSCNVKCENETIINQFKDETGCIIV